MECLHSIYSYPSKKERSLESDQITQIADEKPVSLFTCAARADRLRCFVRASSGIRLSSVLFQRENVQNFLLYLCGAGKLRNCPAQPLFQRRDQKHPAFFHCHDARKGRLRAGAGAAGKQPLPRCKLYADGFLPACRAEQRRRRAGVPLHDAPVRAHQPHADRNRAGCADAKLADQSENRHLLLRLCGDLEMDGLYDGHPACGASGDRHDLL